MHIKFTTKDNITIIINKEIISLSKASHAGEMKYLAFVANCNKWEVSEDEYLRLEKTLMEEK